MGMSKIKYELNINTDKGKINVKWSDVKILSQYATIQSGRYLQNQADTLELHYKKFENWYQMFWDQRFMMGAFDLPKAATIIDIGSGASIIDLILYSYIPDSKFYLVDKEEWGLKFRNNGVPETCFSKDYPFYHSWSTVTDAIESSKFNADRFVFLDPKSNFPDEVDAVTSYFSWCFHYPKEVYWDRMMSSLKKGGILLLDVRLLKCSDVIGEISESMKSNPIKIEIPKLPEYIDDYEIVDMKTMGYRCLWIKK